MAGTPLRLLLARAGAAICTSSLCAASLLANAYAAGHPVALGRARSSYAAMLNAFRHGPAYTETSGAAAPTAYVWPLSQALAASLAMAQLPGAPRAYRDGVERGLEALERYWVPGPPGVYDASPGEPAAFYDDNEWIGLDLVAAAGLLHRPELLARAGAIFGLVAAGWSRADAACPGGVYWQRTPPDTDRAAVTTANGALLALQLYRATGRPQYVLRARQMVSWLQQCLQRPDGLIANDIDGEVRNDRAWSYNQGATIADLVLLAQITGHARYLSDAQRIASASLAAYGTTFAGEPRAFVAVFFRDLGLLDAAAPNARYRRALQAYADAQWQSGRDRTTGLFGADLLDQAGMVQIYAQLAASGLTARP